MSKDKIVNRKKLCFVKISADIHKKLKVMSVIEDKLMQELVDQALLEFMEKSK